MKLIFIILFSTASYSLIIGQTDTQFDGVQNFTGVIYRSGNVGIGTNNSPNGKLHVAGDFIQSRSNGGFVFTQGYTTGQHFLSIAPNASGSYSTDWQWSKGLTFDGWTGQLTKSVSNDSDLALAVAVGSDLNFKVYGDGTVNIGDCPLPTNPSLYKLYVRTGILAERVKVALTTGTSWADYVFSKNYKLKSLTEVEKYIEKNKHLPDMPSGQQLYEEGGVDVFEMLKLQQQKIEELTLYIIELDKKVKRLEN